MAAVLVDAGALVALLDGADVHHGQAAEALRGIRDPLATVWPPLVEAMHLLGGTSRGGLALCDMVADGAVSVLDLGPSDFPRVKALMEKYRDLPMDFADAALVRAAERERLTQIVTFDGHFEVYRLGRRGRFTVLPSRASASRRPRSKL